jgi:hypothetical protein
MSAVAGSATAVRDLSLLGIHRFWRLGLVISANDDANNHNINLTCLIFRDPFQGIGLFVCHPNSVNNLSRFLMAKEARCVSMDTQKTHMKHKHVSYAWEVTSEAHCLGTDTAAASGLSRLMQGKLCHRP